MTDKQKRIQAYDPNEKQEEAEQMTNQKSAKALPKTDQTITDERQSDHQDKVSKKSDEDSWQDLDVDKLPKGAFAGFWPRTFAYLIDTFFIHLIQRLVYNLTIYQFLGPDTLDAWWIQLIDLFIFVAYFALTTYYLKGQTLGKVLLGLRVIQADGSPLSSSSLLVREIAGKIIIKSLPIIAVFLVFDSKCRHFIDQLCDTIVVNENQLKMLADYQ